MSERDDLHLPTPEFRASLERDIVDALRRERRFEPALRAWWRRRTVKVVGLAAAAVAILTVGLVLGVSTGYASAEVLDARQRAATAATMVTRRQLAAVKLDLARHKYDYALRAFQTGKGTRLELHAADLEVRDMEANVARVEADMKSFKEAVTLPRPVLAILGAAPMRGDLAVSACAVVSPPPATQTPLVIREGIPVIELAPTSEKTPVTIGAVFGVRELPGGKVLINDGMRHQLRLFDSTLSVSTIVMDSVSGTSTSYGRSSVRAIPYLGDSTIFPHAESRSLAVLDRFGQVARMMALPNGADFFRVASTLTEADDKGRLLYGSSAPSQNVPIGVPIPQDSVVLVRADFDLRRVDTVGRLGFVGEVVKYEQGEDGRARRSTVITSPVVTYDDWAVLSDGTIAFVRGQDYHIDWIHPDGTRSATSKLPFDWKRVTDEEKQRLVDSARIADENRRIRVTRPTANGNTESLAPWTSPVRHEYAALKDIADYYPPIRGHATYPDRDGNLWILPNTTAQSLHGELVYDVVNVKNGLYERVRMPVGKSVVGFGKNGVVYLVSGDRTNGFYVERARLPAGASPPK